VDHLLLSCSTMEFTNRVETTPSIDVNGFIVCRCFQMEVTNEIEFLLPMMSTVMMAKCIGDFFTRPFDHALIKQRCIPFLSQEPSISLADHTK